MIPENVVFVAFSFPPNRRFYKEIISVSREIVLRGIKRYWRAQQRSDGDDYKDEKIDKKTDLISKTRTLNAFIARKML